MTERKFIRRRGRSARRTGVIGFRKIRKIQVQRTIVIVLPLEREGQVQALMVMVTVHFGYALPYLT